MERLANFCAILAGAIMMLMVGHILVEIALRSVWNSSTYVLDEFVGYGVAAMTFLALPRAVFTDNLIKVSLVDSIVRRDASRRMLTLFRDLASFAICSGLAFFIGRSALRNFNRGRVSETIAEVPLWLPEAIVLLGLGAFLALLLSRIISALFSSSKTLVTPKG